MQIPYPASQSGKALEKHSGSTLKLVLPNNLTTHNIGWLSVWCRKFKVNFGHITFPKKEAHGEKFC